MQNKPAQNLQPANFKLKADFKPCGDQPKAIEALNQNIEHGEKFQTLLGVTGSGKTYTIANVIAKQQRPALVIAPNKTLAAQLYAEFRDFFPENNVRYFVSYYDYFQPEAFIPSTNTYIEKDSAINQEIDKMRHAATKALLESRDTIIIASVSCIYGLGAPDEYFKMMLYLEQGEKISPKEVIRKLVTIQYRRSDLEFSRGNFRVRGETIDIFPADQDACAFRLIFFGDEVEEISEIDSITGQTIKRLKNCCIYPTSHYVTSAEAVEKAMVSIRRELKARIPELHSQGKILEAQRLEQRTLYDLELLDEVGFCSGIENYSRHLTGREAGQPPATLIDYFPKDYLLVLDESHVTVPQLGGMYRGDRSRKSTLVDHGFRLPSALDNRPLNSEEFWQRAGQTIFVSATPANYEIEQSAGKVVEQIIRPTGLLDPEIFIRPATNQVDDLIEQMRQVVKDKEKVLVLTLTKKMSEDLADYLREIGVRVRYLHSEIDTLERFEILKGLKEDQFDVLIGINLLREGLDLPMVSLVAILDADKEGFLRSRSSLIQIMGRAARNLKGRVFLYADKITDSIKQAVDETRRRRKIQEDYNTANGITPKSVEKKVYANLIDNGDAVELEINKDKIIIPLDKSGQQKLIDQLRKQMFDAAAKKEFEQAAVLRDQINRIQEEILKF